MILPLHDLVAAAPLIIICLVGLLVLVVEALVKETEIVNCWVTGVGFFATTVVSLATLGSSGPAFHGMLTTGGFSSFFAAIFSIAGLLSVMLSKSYLRKEDIEHGEYYALLLFAVSGMMLMAAAADLIVFFLGLEIMSVCFYVLAGFIRRRLTSNEAALKYFLLGAFATGFLLYGIALIYGSTGTTAIEPITQRAGDLVGNPIFVIGLALLLIGLVFKVAAVPFHMWVPDVYEGAPTTVTGFMSTGGKAAAFSVFLLLFAPKVLVAASSLRDIIAVLAALSMIVGNIIAIAQNSIKRMLAYSTIAHAGYILSGVVAANAFGSNGILFYLLSYTVMNIGAFGTLSLLEAPDGGGLAFEDYAGLSARKPLLAGMMALFMFSLSGIPPLAGFFGKYYVFAGAVEAGYTWLAIVGVVMSVVSAYYYLRLVVVMYFREGGEQPDVPVSRLGFAALVISTVAILGLGLFPSIVLNVTTRFF
jgi:NADH-quinone oxidoreductase subunit N